MLELYGKRQDNIYEKINIKFRVFGGGEPHLYVEDKYKEFQEFLVKVKFKKSEDIINLVLLSDTIDNFPNTKSKELEMFYVPFSRQDRRTSLNEPFSLKAFGGIINSLKFNKVITLDNHSYSVESCINNVVSIPSNERVLKELKTLYKDGYDCIISPDLGATKKCESILKDCLLSNLKIGLVKANKIRDLLSGEILSTELYGNVENKKCIIIDDICDGGRTFIELAKVLYKNKASEVSLIVTHGIFSRGKEVLEKANIKNVICLNDLSKEGE